ncbi:hypothetical protein RFI_10109 [Reticulomyxa filosa]|uniref:Uncharacterized protein n=1 Tax=Reticulomyxa filosa TaxID=46433 RepID=X6NMV6_RETFI|nr:hypothetical protein RFI_10109 [Reticulomyxa filosa]|eukprot:ETO27024.1 hypothetical protein RFI_10109 [Reticulomyxa filosa]
MSRNALSGPSEQDIATAVHVFKHIFEKYVDTHSATLQINISAKVYRALQVSYLYICENQTAKDVKELWTQLDKAGNETFGFVINRFEITLPILVCNAKKKNLSFYCIYIRQDWNCLFVQTAITLYSNSFSRFHYSQVVDRDSYGEEKISTFIPK